MNTFASPTRVDELEIGKGIERIGDALRSLG